MLLASLARSPWPIALLAFVLYFLLRADRGAPAAGAQGPAAAGAAGARLLLIVGGVLTQLDVADLADEFVSSGPRTESRAEDLLDDRRPSGADPRARRARSAWRSPSCWSAVNGMRVGLLSRFMGVLGIIVGALLVLPLFPGGQGIVQIFWTVALGFAVPGQVARRAGAGLGERQADAMAHRRRPQAGLGGDRAAHRPRARRRRRRCREASIARAAQAQAPPLAEPIRAGRARR